MKIVIAFDSAFYLSGRQALNCLKNVIRPQDSILVVDLGLSQGKLKFLSKHHPDVEIQTLDWSLLDEDWKKDKQSYYFKSIIWGDLLNKKIKDVVLVVDSACMIYRDLDDIENLIKECQVYTPYSAEDIKRYCHPTSIKKFGFTLPLDCNMRSGGCLGINLGTPIGQAFAGDFVKLCNDKDIIVPDGSNKSNHRQDQSVLSMLYHLYKMRCKLFDVKEWFGISFHRNLWNNEVLL